MHHLDLKFKILKKFSSQADFCLVVSEHESKVSQVLRGRRKLSQEEAEKWAKTLDCDPATLKSVVEQNESHANKKNQTSRRDQG